MPSVQVPGGSDHLIQSSSPCPPRTSNSLRSNILRNTCISRHHLTPEIALRLITPECDIYHRPIAANSEDGGHGFDADPFWGFYWPGGQALTRYVAFDSWSLHSRSQLKEVYQLSNELAFFKVHPRQRASVRGSSRAGRWLWLRGILHRGQPGRGQPCRRQRH